LKDSQRKETRALPTAGVASPTFVSHGPDGVRAVRPSKDRPGYPRYTSLQGCLKPRCNENKIPVTIRIPTNHFWPYNKEKMGTPFQRYFQSTFRRISG
jgi:hypothetical protein